jgi:phosphoribosylformylglycinamidine synthase subunit PurS
MGQRQRLIAKRSAVSGSGSGIRVPGSEFREWDAETGGALASGEPGTTEHRKPSAVLGTRDPELETRNHFVLVEPLMSLDGGGLSMKVRVIVMPKTSVLDPQGVAIRNALKEVGLEQVENVRAGKMLELDFVTAPDQKKLDEVCHDLLSNPVIEDYVIQVMEQK